MNSRFATTRRLFIRAVTASLTLVRRQRLRLQHLTHLRVAAQFKVARSILASGRAVRVDYALQLVVQVLVVAAVLFLSLRYRLVLSTHLQSRSVHEIIFLNARLADRGQPQVPLSLQFLLVHLQLRVARRHAKLSTTLDAPDLRVTRQMLRVPIVILLVTLLDHLELQQLAGCLRVLQRGSLRLNLLTLDSIEFILSSSARIMLSLAELVLGHLLERAQVSVDARLDLPIVAVLGDRNGVYSLLYLDLVLEIFVDLREQIFHFLEHLDGYGLVIALTRLHLHQLSLQGPRRLLEVQLESLDRRVRDVAVVAAHGT